MAKDGTQEAPKPNKNALILSGGGARAAYQVGVLKAVSRLTPGGKANPFPIICGTSAGAINAAVLATYAKHFRIGVRRLDSVWSNFHTEQIYRADIQGLGKMVMRWVWAIMRGQHRPKSLAFLDNAPLARLLNHVVPLDRIQEAIDAGVLDALCVTASGYTSGESVSFFQGHDNFDIWRRTRRSGAKTKLTHAHLLASSAIPMLFPAVKINREYFGDGAVRFLAPLSPAVHLGANKLMIIGVDNNKPSDNQRQHNRPYPSIAEMASHVLDSVFIDSLDSDIERLERINRTLDLIPSHSLEEHGSPLNKIEPLLIAPSKDLNEMAAQYEHCLPGGLRFLLHRLGISEKTGTAILSYLLFEKEYTQELIELGYTDAMNMEGKIRHFLDDTTIL